MNMNDAPRLPGIIGCLDPSGAALRCLADWCRGRGAEQLHGGPQFGLWLSLRGHGAVHSLTKNGFTGVLVGQLFADTETADTRQADCPFAERVTNGLRDGGVGALADLDGQFSLVLWDARRQELILYRDASAARSLYFHRMGNDGLVFADDLDLLIRSPLVKKRLSRRSLHEFLRFLDVSPPNCIYEGVTSAEPGVAYRMGRALERTQPEESASPRVRTMSLEDAATELECLLSDSITARLAPERKTIAFLSGGVDSSLVCALAAKKAQDRIHAVTVGFEESELDESAVARRVAEHLGIEHQVLAFPMTAYRAGFEKLVTGISYPSADPAGLPTLLAFESARDIGCCALDGTGADTLFGVMPARHQRLAIELGILIPPPLRRLATFLMTHTPGLAGYAPLVDFDDPEEVLIRWRGWRRRELEQLCAEPVSLAHTRFYQLFRRFPRRAHMDRYSALLGNLPDDRVHQAAELTDLDVRFPYVDRAVTDWVRALSVDLRYLPGEPKRLLKTVLARHVPRSLWDLPKHGFDFPFLRLMVAEDYSLVRTYLDSAVTARWGLFDQERLETAKNALMTADRRSPFSADSPAFRTWALVVLFAWLEHHYRGL
jgi:asparagine synthase (glutamine-hydrolysing)